MKNDAHFKYLFIETTDRELFGQYVELRRRVYFEEYPWLTADFGYEDETDRVSRIVVAVRNDGIVAGGARLTISAPECPCQMPLEEVNFRLRNCEFLSDLNLDRKPYGEISRMAAEPESAKPFELSWGLGNALCARAAREGLDVVFSICPELPARINQRNAKRRGAGFHRYPEVPTVFGKRMWLCAFTGLLLVYGNGEREAA
jgi:hypothetical protein